MTAVEMLLHQPVAQAVGWALVHFVWQGTLIAAVTGLLLMALRRSAADVRYVVATIALTLMVTLPTVTAVQAWRTATASVAQSAVAEAASPLAAGVTAQRAVDALEAPAAAETPAPSLVESFSPLDRTIRRVRVEPWIPALLFVWLCGVTVLTLRLASGWMWVQRTKSHSAVPAAHNWQDMATRLSRRLHITRPIRLLESAVVEVPTVIGWLKPVVLFPTSALAGLTPHQMEAILAHELAHVRRHDYLVNLLQTLVETLLFYHPAVWWLSRRIRVERENCCDDLAVSLCGDPLTYASALADLEELRGAGRELVLAASGGSLLQRVRRLLGAPTHAGRAPGWLAGCIAILLMSGMAAGVVGNGALSSGDRQTAAVAQQAQVASEAALVASAASPQSASVATSNPAGVPVERRKAAVQVGVADAAQAADVRPRVDAVARVAVAADVTAGVDVAVAPGVSALATPVATSRVARLVATAEASGQDSVRVNRGRQRGNHSWSINGEKFELSYDGEIEFTDDDTDIRSLSPGGYFKISDGGWFGGKGVDIRADAAGAITRRFRVGIIEKPYEPEGRAWLAQMLPRFIRQSGIGAPARVARILKSKGPAGVLSEISLIEGGYGKRIYFTELFRTASLDAGTVRQAFAQASREVKSDYELASLLIASQHLINDEATRKAYFDASATIRSDYEMRRVLSAGLKAGPVPPAVLASVLSAATSIEGDYELASLLVQVATLQPLDGATRRPFFTALDTVGGAYEHGRVLQTLSARGDLSSELLVSMLQSGARMRSDYEQVQFLLKVAKAHTIDATLRGPFFAAVDAVKSPYEKGRVLQTVVKRAETPAETILAVLRSASTLSGSYERSQVLLAVAASHQISGPARDAYIEAAEKLGEYEQGRALTALVKNERGQK
jgi:beta-lactamase regulating signal transducer with metallopeptidase domain